MKIILIVYFVGFNDLKKFIDNLTLQKVIKEILSDYFASNLSSLNEKSFN